ncbi:MAG: chromosome segregation protein SMC [Gammaproteobacteria bacterium]|nr:chromosome segregation protein SMC [Gammaproteobacteria bacterium]
MRLTRIKLAGFKSFVDPTTVHLPSSLIGVVGPNGCGKSNVIDAVRWVMGESSARHLRGDSMEDVIFNGSSARKPVGQASVELIFNNSDGRLGGKYANYVEISVKRQVSREGQSVYTLNGSRCRRRDITDIFLGTGLGPRSYAIIEQGMISRLVEAKPEDLRVYVEEAAGISRYRERRRETESRIAHTRDNLERLNDLREEVAKQIQHLDRQARAAERYKRYKEEERRKRAELLALRWRDLQQDAQRQQRLLQSKQTQLDAIVAEQRRWEAQLERDRARLAEANQRLNDAQGGYYEVGNEISRIEQTIQHNRETTARQQRELESVGSALSASQRDVEQDSERLRNYGTALAQDEPAHEALLAEQKRSAEQLTSAQQSMRQWEERWDDYTQRESEVRQRIEVQQSRIEQLRRHSAQTGERRDKLVAELSTLSTDEFAASRAVGETQLRDSRDSADQLQSQVDESNLRLTQAREALQQTQQKLNVTQTELQDLRGRLASLQALQQAALGSEEETPGNRWLSTQGLTGQRLAQNLDVDKGWELAVETALGAYLEATCVAPGSYTAANLSALSEGHVLMIERGQDAAPAPAGALASCARAPVALSDLLRGIHTAGDLAEALERRARLGPGESIITPAGEWLGREWVRVTRRMDEGESVLAREQELRRLQELVSVTGARADDLEAQRLQQSGELEDHERRRERLLQELAEAHRQVAVNESAFNQLSGKQQQIEEQILRLRHESGELEQQLRNDGHELQTAQEILASASRDAEMHEAERRDLSQQKEQLLDSLDDAQQQSQSDVDAGHEIAVRLQSMRTALETTERHLNRMREQLLQLQERRDQLHEALASSEAPQQKLQKNLDELLEQRVSADKRLIDARHAVEGIESELNEAGKSRSDQEQAAQEARQALSDDRLKLQELQVRGQTLEEQLVETGFTREQLIEELAEDASAEACDEALAALERRINRLGAINLAAIDEHQETLQRQEYLDRQYKDVNDALTTLEEAIEKIDAETRSRFKATYERVNIRLQEIFPRLFGGGQGFLEMTGDDLLTTGIAVMARPPGKRISNIHLLSGGEKALTAVALVFAFFELNPAPFCMLDEVDAPLDDANVGRYCELVKEMSERVQFIFITHNKTTMELSDQLMGVTMQEPGVSRLVSVDVQEAARLATA